VIVFLDACALIYRVEEVAPWNRRVAQLLAAYLRKHAGLRLVVSRLSQLECRVQPLRESETDLLARYDALFSAPDLQTVEIDANVIEGATEIRARFGLRTPDAIQAASCLSLDESHVFVTNDRTFTRVPKLSAVLL
jgi:predicted nucleic acid-binding protein